MINIGLLFLVVCMLLEACGVRVEREFYVVFVAEYIFEALLVIWIVMSQ